VLYCCCCCYCFCFALYCFCIAFVCAFLDHTSRGIMSCCCCCRPPKSSQLARHLILNHTYALSGTDISVLSIERHSGPNLPPWILMTQSACTVDHSAPGPVPFRNAFGRMIHGTTRAGPVFLICLMHFYGFRHIPAPTKQHPRSSRPRRPGEQEAATERRSAAPSSSAASYWLIVFLRSAY
jgi:hypothetical protein